MIIPEDIQYMRRALASARKAWPAPNPRVGALVVKNGKVVGRGRHQKAGEPHAEVLALKQAGTRAKGATLYITLEPCCHQGKTGPCVDAVLQAGIARVVAGCVDPNPVVAGKGLVRLREQGVQVVCPVLPDDCTRLIAGHAKFVTTGLPYLTYKYAMTLDGKVATASGKSRWITGETARREVHKMRRDSDAVIVGLGTALADDPELTVRLVSAGRQPLRVILDSYARLSPSSALFSASGGDVVVITSDEAPAENLKALEAAGARILCCGDKRVDLRLAMEKLAVDFGVREALLEGGPDAAASALEAGLVDEVVAFVAGKIFGGAAAPGPIGGDGVLTPDDAYHLEIKRIRKTGEDYAVNSRVCYPLPETDSGNSAQL